MRIVGELDLIVGGGKFFRSGVLDNNDSVMMYTGRKTVQSVCYSIGPMLSIVRRWL